MATRAPSEGQVTLLFVVAQNGPASVADVAGHLLMDDKSARDRLATLERRGLVSRQYTGHHRGSTFAYVITATGQQAIADRDDPAAEEALAPGECWACGRTDGRHVRACVNNPDRTPRRTS